MGHLDVLAVTLKQLTYLVSVTADYIMLLRKTIKITNNRAQVTWIPSKQHCFVRLDKGSQCDVQLPKSWTVLLRNVCALHFIFLGFRTSFNVNKGCSGLVYGGEGIQDTIVCLKCALHC